MESRFVVGVSFLVLFAMGVGLFLWLGRHYREGGRTLVPKVACAWAAVSFVFVGWGVLFATALVKWPERGGPTRPGDKELPPDVFAILPPAMFSCAALLATLGLLLAAAFQLVLSWPNPSAGERRRNAAHLARYGVAALVLAIAHLWLLRLVPGLVR